ncbi:methyltransferase domain-containing protein [Sorangium sp. So ce1128]
MKTVRDRAADQYNASSILVLSGLSAVRQRPAMYIGSTGARGVLHLVEELVQNAVDEAMAGFCMKIVVTQEEDGSFSVEDDGRGIPVDRHPETGRPACETVLTTLHAGAKFKEGAYAVAGGLHGVGLACVNALSEWLVLDVWRDGRHHTQRFARGDVVEELMDRGPASRRGTRVYFRPDREIFGGAAPPVAELARRLKEHAFLEPGLTIEFEHRPAEREVYHYDTGVVGFVEHLNKERHPIHAPVRLCGAHDGVAVDVALQWTSDYTEDISSYVNRVATSRGGTHVDGLNAALTRVINGYAVANGLLDAELEEIAGFDIREGLTCVLSIELREPRFDGQTKSVLTSPEATEAVARVATRELSAALDRNADLAVTLVGRAIESARARAAARRAGERARYQSVEAMRSKEIYKAQFGIRSRNWHQSARWITDSGLLDAHTAACRVDKNARVLDVCCGSGVVGASFRDRVGAIVGLDLTPEMVKLAQTRLDEVHQGDVYDIPFPSASFDLVVNREVLHLLPRPDRPVAEIFRVLKPGGQFIVGQLVPFCDIDAPWMFRVLKKKQPLFFNNFTEQDFRALLERAGFRDIQVTEYLQWEDIDLWIETHETPIINRHEIRDLYYGAPRAVRAVHPFEVTPSGAIHDCWRWCIFAASKP